MYIYIHIFYNIYMYIYIYINTLYNIPVYGTLYIVYYKNSSQVTDKAWRIQNQLKLG